MFGRVQDKKNNCSSNQYSNFQTRLSTISAICYFAFYLSVWLTFIRILVLTLETLLHGNGYAHFIIVSNSDHEVSFLIEVYSRRQCSLRNYSTSCSIRSFLFAIAAVIQKLYQLSNILVLSKLDTVLLQFVERLLCAVPFTLKRHEPVSLYYFAEALPGNIKARIEKISQFTFTSSTAYLNTMQPNKLMTKMSCHESLGKSRMFDRYQTMKEYLGNGLSFEKLIIYQDSTIKRLKLNHVIFIL